MNDASWKNLFIFMWGMYAGIFVFVMSLISYVILLGLYPGPELEFALTYFFTMIYAALFLVAVLGDVMPIGRKSK